MMKRCNLDKKSSEEILDILRNYRLRLEKDVLPQNPNDQQHSKEIKETRPVSVPLAEGKYYNLQGIVNGQCKKYLKIEPEDNNSGKIRYVDIKTGTIDGYEWVSRSPATYKISDKGEVCVDMNNAPSDMPSLYLCNGKLIHDDPEPEDQRGHYVLLPLHPSCLLFEDKDVLSGGYSHFEDGTKKQFIFFSNGTVNIYENVLEHPIFGHEPYYKAVFQTDGRYLRHGDYLLISKRIPNKLRYYEEMVYLISNNKLHKDVYINSTDKNELEHFFVENLDKLHG